MSTLEVLLTLALAVAFLVVLLLALSLHKAVSKRKAAYAAAEAIQSTRNEVDLDHQVLLGKLRYKTGGPLRYEVVLDDWGPDFTGEGGSLPRWRWIVLDADRDLRQILGETSEDSMGTDEHPFMLGNENSAMLALFSALEWVENERHPMHAISPVVVP